jgi:hypothetical protein
MPPQLHPRRPKQCDQARSGHSRDHKPPFRSLGLWVAVSIRMRRPRHYQDRDLQEHTHDRTRPMPRASLGTPALNRIQPTAQVTGSGHADMRLPVTRAVRAYLAEVHCAVTRPWRAKFDDRQGSDSLIASNLLSLDYIARSQSCEMTQAVHPGNHGRNRTWISRVDVTHTSLGGNDQWRIPGSNTHRPVTTARTDSHLSRPIRGRHSTPRRPTLSHLGKARRSFRRTVTTLPKGRRPSRPTKGSSSTRRRVRRSHMDHRPIHSRPTESPGRRAAPRPVATHRPSPDRARTRSRPPRPCAVCWLCRCSSVRSSA